MGGGGVQSWGCAQELGEDALDGLSCSRRACVCVCVGACLCRGTCVCMPMGARVSVGESTGSPMTGAWMRLKDCGGAWTRLDNGGGLLACSGSTYTTPSQLTARPRRQPGGTGRDSPREAGLTFSLEIMLASASSLALFWCTSLLANIFA